MITKYMLAWLVLPVIGIVNGIMRQAGYHDLLGDLAAHQVYDCAVCFLPAVGAEDSNCPLIIER